MTFTAGTGTKRAVSAKTRKQIERTNVLLGLVDRSDEAKFKGGEERLFMQRRTFGSSATTEVTRSDTANSGGLRAWATLKQLNATEITVQLRDGEEQGYGVPRLDNLQSPLNEVESTRRKIAKDNSDEIETNLRDYILGLASTGNASVNGKAGPVTEETVGTSGTDSISLSGKTLTGFTGEDNPLLQIVDDLVLKAKRRNWLDGVPIFGTVPATLYLVVHAELFLFQLVKSLRDAGYSLDSLTTDVLARSAVFSSSAFMGRLGVQKLTIVCPNVLAPPADVATDWEFWGGYSEAIVGGIGPILTQLISPEDNQIGDGWALRQVVNPYYNLLTGSGIVRYVIDAVAN